jgi:dihydrofolate reductase
MKVSVFVGVSVDGFLARRDGGLDFLDAGGNEPHGFEEFFASVDVLVVGRGTFDVVQGFPEWPYGGKRVVVLSSRQLDLSALSGARVEQMSGDPAAIAAKLAAQGVQHIYVDGGITIQGFLRAGLVNSLTVTRVPILIGEGIPLFGSVPHDVLLRHVATRTYKGGLVQSEYEISTANEGSSVTP